MLTFLYRVVALASIALFTIPAIAQRTGSGNPGATSSSSGTRPGANSNNSGRGFPNSDQNSQLDRQIYFVEGKVVLPDGGSPPEPVAIERVCNGAARREAYTDAKGRFQFQLGQNNGILQDATESSFSLDPFSSRGPNSPTSGGISRRELLGCELRALLPGFQSSTVMLRPEGNFGQLQVGTIVLKPLGGTTESVISLTSLQAPKDAKHAYEKAQKALNEKKLDNAEKELQKAVSIYPQYATAWSLLGAVHSQLNQVDAAYHDFSQAVTADPKFVNPYYGLTVLALKGNKWQDVVQYTDQIAKLNPFAFPIAFFYSAAANFNLGNLDAAERNARKYMSMETEHRRPEVALLLGEILTQKRDYAGAAEQKKMYLTMAPNAPNSEAVRADVKKLEELSQKKTN